MKFLWIAAAGALGAVLRVAVAGAVQRGLQSEFPWGTLVVNVTGCFAFGLIWSLMSERQMIAQPMGFYILSGFLGAFTTFSAYGFETAELAIAGQWGHLVGSVLAENIVGVAAVFAGIGLGRL